MKELFASPSTLFLVIICTVFVTPSCSIDVYFAGPDCNNTPISKSASIYTSIIIGLPHWYYNMRMESSFTSTYPYSYWYFNSGFHACHYHSDTQPYDYINGTSNSPCATPFLAPIGKRSFIAAYKKNSCSSISADRSLFYMDVKTNFDCYPLYTGSLTLSSPETGISYTYRKDNITFSWFWSPTYAEETYKYCSCSSILFYLGPSTNLRTNPSYTINCSSSKALFSMPTPNNSTVPRYYWGVAIYPINQFNIYEDQSSLLSASNSFCIKGFPSNPVLNLPTNDSVLRVGDSHEFQWSLSSWGWACTSPEVHFFTIEIYCDSKLVTNTILNESTFSYVPTSLPTESASCTWKIYATNSLTSSSHSKAFSMCKPSSPSFSSILSPNNLTYVNQETNTNLSWTLTSWGNICSSESQNGKFIVLVSQTQPVTKNIANTTDTRFLVPSKLSLGTWFWQIKAINSIGLFSYSDVGSFISCAEESPVSPPLLQPMGESYQIAISASSAAINFIWDTASLGKRCGIITQSFILSITTPSGLNLSKPTLLTSTSMILSEVGTYFYSVTVSNGLLSSTSVKGNFSICHLYAPDSPVITVTSGTTLIGASQTFTWTIDSTGNTCNQFGKVTYYVHLSKDAPSTSIYDTVEDPIKSISVNHLTVGTWFLSVDADNEVAITTGNSISFTVCIVEEPSPLVVLSPGNSFDNKSLVFEWETPQFGISCSSTSANTITIFWGSTIATLTVLTSITYPTSDDYYDYDVPTAGTYYYYFNISNGVSSIATSPVMISVDTDCAVQDPDQTILDLPSTFTSFYVNLITFSWVPPFFGESCIESPLKYFELLIDSEVFTTGISSLSKSISVNISKTGNHYWSIKLINGNLTTLSEERNFSICIPKPPSIPQLLQPVNGSMVVYPYTFAWSAVNWTSICGASRTYILNVPTIGSYTLLGNVTSMISSVDVSAGTYSWSVTAKAMKSSISKISYFSVCKPSRPLKPTLSLPEENGIVTKPITFSWFSPSDPGESCGSTNATYLFILRGPTQEASFLVGNSTSITLQNNLIEGTYNFTVQMFNGYSWSFEATPHEFAVCDPVQPEEIELLTPLNGTTAGITGNSITLTWREALDILGVSCSQTSPPFLQMNIVYPGEQLINAHSSRLGISSTSFTISNVSAGVYSWWLTLNNGRNISQSKTNIFSICQPMNPNGISLIYPTNGTKVIGSTTSFSWNISSFGLSCDDKAQRYINLLLNSQFGQSTPTMQPIAHLHESTTSIEMQIESGQHEWTIVAQNGLYSTTAEIYSFSVCIPQDPTAPTLKEPSSGSVIEKSSIDNITFSAMQFGGFGNPCGAALKNKRETVLSQSTGFRLLFGTSTLQVYDTIYVSRSVDTSNNPISFVLKPSDIANGDILWRMDTFNEDGSTTSSDTRFILVCQNPAPTIPINPANNSVNISTSSITLSWSELSESNWGYSCTKSHILSYKIYWQNFTLGEPIPEDLPFRYSVSSTTTEFIISKDILDISLNTTFAWRIGVHNGGAEILSDTFIFTTTTIDCRTISCGIGGECDDNTLSCKCYSGWSGTFCDIPEKSNVGLIVGIIIGVILFAFIIFAVIFALIAYRRKKHQRKRFHLIAPSPALRFAACVVPPSEYADSPEAFESKLLADAPAGFPFVLSLTDKVGPSVESDSIAKALVMFYEYHAIGNSFLKALISHEVKACKSLDVLFRNNSMAAKAFKFYSRMVGLQFLFEVIGPMLEELLQKEADAQLEQEEEEKLLHSGKVISVRLFSEGKHEVDPNKMSCDDLADLDLNSVQLCLTTQKFIAGIFRTARKTPLPLREIYRHLYEEVNKKFNDEQEARARLGAFVFLRFLSVGITVPESFGLLTSPPGPILRRTLLLVAKIIQRLASGGIADPNETLLKESFMKSFESLIRDNLPGLDEFYKNITTAQRDEGDEVIEAVKIPDEIYHNSLSYAHWFYLDQLEHEQKAQLKAKAKEAEKAKESTSSPPPPPPATQQTTTKQENNNSNNPSNANPESSPPPQSSLSPQSAQKIETSTTATETNVIPNDEMVSPRIVSTSAQPNEVKIEQQQQQGEQTVNETNPIAPNQSQ